jgi:hypothetical protein
MPNPIWGKRTLFAQ